MKWILAILCGLALQAGAITNGVFATKSPYVVEAATMPFDTWTNSVLWLTAESPIIRSGATNVLYPCYAKNCFNTNITQATASLQPIIRSVAGTNELYFDADDVLPVGPFPFQSNFTFSCKFFVPALANTNAGLRTYIFSSSAAAGNWGFQVRTNRQIAFTHVGIGAKDLGLCLTGVWNNIFVTRTTNTVYSVVNGVTNSQTLDTSSGTVNAVYFNSPDASSKVEMSFRDILITRP